jgi:hypothetical protein
MSKGIAIIRISALASLLILVVAGAGFGAPGSPNGSQTVTIAAAAGIEISVAGAASIGSTVPGACGTTSTTVNVKSNKAWNLQVRSEPGSYPNGKAKNGGTEMTDAFEYQGGDVSSYTAITSSYSNLFTANQAKTTGLGEDVAVDYQQCVQYEDSPGNYTIVIEYLGVQP